MNGWVEWSLGVDKNYMYMDRQMNYADYIIEKPSMDGTENSEMTTRLKSQLLCSYLPMRECWQHCILLPSLLYLKLQQKFNLTFTIILAKTSTVCGSQKNVDTPVIN